MRCLRSDLNFETRRRMSVISSCFHYTMISNVSRLRLKGYRKCFCIANRMYSRSSNANLTKVSRLPKVLFTAFFIIYSIFRVFILYVTYERTTLRIITSKPLSNLNAKHLLDLFFSICTTFQWYDILLRNIPRTSILNTIHMSAPVASS